MSTVYALLAGIDDYRGTRHRSLAGCVNDVCAARDWLNTRAAQPRLRELHNRDATREAVIAGVREHLGRAGPGDTALFWFAGHGAQRDAGTHAEKSVEATGKIQALVCRDDWLPDKELGPLLDAVAERGGHVVAVLDCCFSGGGTRLAGLTARGTGPDPAWRLPAPDPAAGNRGTEPPPPQRHLLLAASRLNELAYERTLPEEEVRGQFSHALLSVLAAAPEGISGRRLMAAATAITERAEGRQHPVLLPQDSGGPPDRPLLGGPAPRDAGPYLLTYGPDGWEVDCGAVHGLRDDAAAGGTEFTLTGPHPHDAPLAGRTLRAGRVLAERTLIDTSGWTPDDRSEHPVALSSVAAPPARVRITAATAADEPAAAALRTAVATAGATGGPSPLLSCDLPGSPAGHGRLRLQVEAGAGTARVRGRDSSGAALPDPGPMPLVTPADAERLAGALAHMARWHQIRELENPLSELNWRIRVEIATWGDAAPRYPDGGGEYLLRYAGRPGAWQRPRVSIRLHNQSYDTLWCVLLDLSDDYAAHSGLFTGHFIGPERVGYALDNAPVRFSVPGERPGTEARDWLKLIVARSGFATAPFTLGPLSQALAGRDGAVRADGSVLRVAGPDPDGQPDPARPAAQWAAFTIPVRTVIPGGR